MQLGTGIMGAETPVDGGLGDVAPDRMGVDCSSQCHVVSLAFLHAVSGNALNSISAMLSQPACLGVW